MSARPTHSGAGSRRERVERTILRALSDLIPRTVSDPRLAEAGLLSVGKVELNRDMSVANVYISFCGGSEAASGVALSVLTACGGRLRGPLARHLGLARAPQLRFYVDPTASVTARLRSIVREDEARRSDRESD